MRCLPKVTGPYQVIVNPNELAEMLTRHRNTIDAWDKRGLISGLRDKPRTAGRGRRYVRYDLWCVLEALRKAGE